MKFGSQWHLQCHSSSESRWSDPAVVAVLEVTAGLVPVLVAAGLVTAVLVTGLVLTGLVAALEVIVVPEAVSDLVAVGLAQMQAGLLNLRQGRGE